MEFNLNTVSFLSEKNFLSIDDKKVYDVVIIGGGPAGLTAAVYCMRKGVSTAIIIKDIGGQVADTASVENYLGYKYINGVELVEKFKEQVQQFSIAYEEGRSVVSLADDDIKKIVLDNGRVVQGKTVIIASGKTWRKLNVPGEERFVGKGVAYCAICDAPLFAGKTAAVVGGGNSGIEAALDLAAIASKVVVVQNLEDLTADKILIEKLSKFTNVEYVFNSHVLEINGDEKVTGLVVENIQTKEKTSIVADGIFISIGLDPNSDFVKGIVDMNRFNEINTDSFCRTSVEGIFAAGDVTSVPFKQIIIAGGEGSKAALSACEYIMKKD
jgi:alkyl hydroperoxide reductase subunit F